MGRYEVAKIACLLNPYFQLSESTLESWNAEYLDENIPIKWMRNIYLKVDDIEEFLHKLKRVHDLFRLLMHLTQEGAQVAAIRYLLAFAFGYCDTDVGLDVDFAPVLYYLLQIGEGYMLVN
jgi:hypothetical protein